MVGPSHALMKKGLRRRSAVLGPSSFRPSHALMKKGLRPAPAWQPPSQQVSQPCPDEEGFECVQSMSRVSEAGVNVLGDDGCRGENEFVRKQVEGETLHVKREIPCLAF